VAASARDTGVLNNAEHDSWLAQLVSPASPDHFYSSINYYVAAGVRPGLRRVP
jgi:hypothetical protein